MIIKKLIVVLVALTFVFLNGCGADKKTEDFYAMGSFITQTVYNGDDQLLESVKTDIVNIEKAISHKDENSLISLLNKENYAVFDTEIYNILFTAVEFCDQTNGIFDISLLWLTDLWDFDTQNPTVPEQSEIEQALAKTGYKNIVLGEHNTVCLSGDVGVDLGAVGKGYACDIAVNKYKAAGVSGVIAVGGSIGINGPKPDGGDFYVGIRDPFSKNPSDVFAGIRLNTGFVSTSGSYEKYFLQDNILYHHILDTKTGYPAESELVSVSIVCDNGMLSDMLSTACYVLGIEDSIKLIEKYGAQAVFVKKDRSVTITNGLRNYVTIYNDSEVSYI